MFVGAIFFPLLGACLSGFLGRWIGDRAAQWSSVGCMALAALCGIAAFAQVALGGQPTTVPIVTWMDVGGLEVSWALRYDTLSVVMVAMVTFISTLIHLYSIGYMSHDATPARFFAYLSLFTFMMLMLVTADNLAQLFFGWEGVGLASYLLIGYWYDRDSANRAAMKAFIVNRVGDVAFMLGIALTFLTFNSIEFATIFASVEAHAHDTFLGINAIELIAVLLFLGACGKSAQLGLHTWLPDAMEGPTPVSALIHAATMVTAGVFLVCRMSPVFEEAPAALTLVTLVGASTAFFAATIGCVQNDIKRVIAYSTCSQLGYMFFAAGVGAYQVAMFHLFTHAFFKALLFLSAGSVIHAMSDEQDMRRMGGIWKKIPVTYAVMWIGNLALAGIPFFAGYYSKDAILEAAFASHSAVGFYAFLMGMVAAFLTAFYSWRLLILTFHGTPRADHHTMAHVHESPLVMLVPLLLLAVGAVLTGAVFAPLFVGEHEQAFWNGAIVNGAHNHIMHAMHEVPGWVPLAPTVMGVAGIALAYALYMFAPGLPTRIAQRFSARPETVRTLAPVPAEGAEQRTEQDPGGLYGFLLKKWYFDELYDRIFVQPARRLAAVFWKVGDARIIDGMPNGAADLAVQASRGAVRIQTGRVANYAFAMIIGLVAFVSLFLLGR
ncbi:NADH-quinone oxidoreductase subunit L [Paracraurococcus ruber]|uniref:NADH-quinone oxidoreductase subunit L n=1 Tax=Paracraurococcus ruber TaxID=77675 RepID=A0ABS1CQK7_9PROT|nr:NADH-quinone oxidoreductase subunit L [Paracraurococcus ruber]MBK1656715.1 NADH-quinone oxidoreductase subunit L [Paracraurococcus ruber]TDG31995.1 NADH-quinone oxidoreductase subunit L [Paracraurococcus ruber]